MAQRSSSKTAKSGARASARGQQALDRLHESIEAADKALKDLRSEMSRGSRALLKDVDGTLRDARKNVRTMRRRVAKELEQAQKAAASKRPGSGRRAATTRSTARKTTAGKTTARKATARKPAARKTTARRSTARKRTTAKK